MTLPAEPDDLESPARRPMLFSRPALFATSAFSIGIALAVRLVHRGPYAPGWDFLGAAEGLYLISTKTPLEILSIYTTEFYGWHLTVWNLFGAPVVLLPGALTALRPWEYWSHEHDHVEQGSLPAGYP